MYQSRSLVGEPARQAIDSILGYDYQIGRDKSDPANVDQIYACRCGSPKCRGSMLWPPKRKRKAAAKKRAPARKSAPRTARKGKGKGKTRARA